MKTNTNYNFKNIIPSCVLPSHESSSIPSSGDGWFRTIVNMFKPKTKTKIQPRGSISHHDITDDIKPKTKIQPRGSSINHHDISDDIKTKTKIQSRGSSINHHDISDDITAYIRCIFHDFRGPLNNISLGTEILMSAVDRNSEEYSTAQTIKESCAFMSESLDGFLNINRLDNIKIHDLQVNYQPFNIIGLIKKIQYILLFNIMEKKIELKYNITPLQEWVLGDYKHIQHVLMNLLSNAIKFSAPRSTIEIKLEGRVVENCKQRVLISIIDQNPFIPEVVKSQLFEKYNTSNNQDGTGLGLYICKRIIETHGGAIYHFNNSKKNTHGNIFQVELVLDVCATSCNQLVSSKYMKMPIRGSLNSGISTSAPKETTQEVINQHDVVIDKSGDKSGSGRKNKRMLLQNILESSVMLNSNNGNQDTKIMVVDDSDLSRKFMAKLIQQFCPEYTIYEAVDGLNALIKMINFNETGKHISMILVDNVMPNLNGELLSKILRGMGYQGLIVGITGNGLQQDIDHYLENGADYVFIKPFTKSNLLALMDFIKREGYESKDDTVIVDNNGVLEWS